MSVNGRSSVLLMWAVASTSCGGGGVEVELVGSSAALLDPFDGALGLAGVRVRAFGKDTNDDVTLDLPPDARRAVFENFPADREIGVRAFGFDALGGVIAFGRLDEAFVEANASVSIPFRRNVAFVTHRPSNRSPEPASALYMIDVATRTLIETIPLPDPGAMGRGVSARGGEGVLVTYDARGSGFIGFLSADTLEWKRISLTRPQDLALSAPGISTGVAAGGGVLSFFELDELRQVGGEVPVGGTVLDGAIGTAGKLAIFVVDVPPGVVLVDLERKTVKSIDVVPSATGVALAGDGRRAFVVSSDARTVAIVDLVNGQSRALRGELAAPVVGAAYSDGMEAVYGLQTGESGSGRVLAYSTPSEAGLPFNQGIPTLPYPSDIAASPDGLRLLVVSSGTSTDTAGLTVIETDPKDTPEASTTSYPSDPEDTFRTGTLTFHQRYQPNKVGILYGR